MKRERASRNNNLEIEIRPAGRDQLASMGKGFEKDWKKKKQEGSFSLALFAWVIEGRTAGGYIATNVRGVLRTSSQRQSCR